MREWFYKKKYLIKISKESFYVVIHHVSKCGKIYLVQNTVTFKILYISCNNVIRSIEFHKIEFADFKN